MKKIILQPPHHIPPPPYLGPLSANDYYRLRTQVFSNKIDLQELFIRCQRTGNGLEDANSAWQYMGDKPLFGHNTIAASRAIEIAWQNNLFPTRGEFASAGWNIIDLNNGAHPRKDARYDVVGELAINFVNAVRGQTITLPSGTSFRQPKTSISRLYQMRQFSIWLMKRCEPNNINHNTAFGGISASLAPGVNINTVEDCCNSLKVQFGLNWGVTTILHGLMDCGFHVVKPDIHVVEAVAKLGCLTPALAIRALAKPSDVGCLFPVVDVARELASRITPLPAAQGHAIREVDIVLNRANYHGAVNVFSRTHPIAPMDFGAELPRVPAQN